MKWSKPWQSTAEKKVKVKVSQLKLLGFQFRENVEDERLKLVAIEVKWKGPNRGLRLVPFTGNRTGAGEITTEVGI